MRIGIIGAGGKSGRHLTAEALRQGHKVTAIVRNKRSAAGSGAAVLERDLFALAPGDVADFDVVIDAFKAPEGKKEQHVTSIEHLIPVFELHPEVRLLVVGGAGSLYTDASRKERLLESKNFPPEFLPDAQNMLKAFEKLQASKTNWTYLSPAAMYDPGGKRTGAYALGGDVMIFNKAGESYVSYADFALAMIDEVKKMAHMRKRFTVVSERG